MSDDEIWMGEALRLARAAASRGEVPVGAVAVLGGRRLSGASNRIEGAGDATAHAEMLCLRRASLATGSWRLGNVTLYVTLEPCPMCASAMVLSRLGRLVYGARDPKKGADGSAYDLLRHPSNNHEVVVTPGVRSDESAALLTGFFAELRARARASRPPGEQSPLLTS